MKRHNRHLLRSLCAVLMMAAMLLSLAACGGSSTFDASGYVSAYLKANLTGDTADLEGATPRKRSPSWKWITTVRSSPCWSL